MSDKIKIYDSWEKLTVGQYERVLEITEQHPDDCARYLVEYLYDIDNAEMLPLQEYSCYVAALRQFINEPVLKARLTPSAAYTINGREYRVDITPAAFTTAQYMDLTNYMKNGARLTDLLSVVLIPNGKMYNDGYDMAAVRRDIEALPVTAGFAVVGFFGRWSKASIKTFLRFLTKQLKMGKVDPKMVEKLEEEIATLLRLLASYPTSSPSARSRTRR